MIVENSLSVVFFKIFDLLHNFLKHFRTVLRWVAILNQTYLDIKLKLIAHNLVIKPVSKRRFCINNILDLFRQSLAFIIDSNTVNDLVLTILKIVMVAQGD